MPAPRPPYPPALNLTFICLAPCSAPCSTLLGSAPPRGLPRPPTRRVQWLLGDSLLVAPVLRPDTDWTEAVFPAGARSTWCRLSDLGDCHTGEEGLKEGRGEGPGGDNWAKGAEGPVWLWRVGADKGRVRLRVSRWHVVTCEQIQAGPCVVLC